MQFSTVIKSPIICNFRWFSLKKLHVLRWNLENSFIIIIFTTSLILSMYVQFSTELCSLDFEKIQIFAVLKRMCSFSSCFQRRGHKCFTTIFCFNKRLFYRSLYWYCCVMCVVEYVVWMTSCHSVYLILTEEN